MRLRNQLWKEENSQPRKKRKKKPPTDPLCESCPNRIIKYMDNGVEKKMPCRGLCPPMQWIDGRGETKELIPTRPIINGIPQVEYNEELYRLMADKESREIEKLEAIRTISDYRIRMIAAATLAEIPQSQIAKIMHSSQSRISRKYRIVKQ